MIHSKSINLLFFQALQNLSQSLVNIKLKTIFLQALADPYFKGLAKVEREPSCQPISKVEFEFERRKVTKDDIRELIFLEILEYHPQLLKDYLNGTERSNFLYPRFLNTFSVLNFRMMNLID